MGRLGLPFVLGPVSGGESVPKALRAGMTQAAQWSESVRDAANWAMRLDPVMRCCFRQAETILLATPESRRLIPRAFQDKCRVQLGVGLSRKYLGWTRQKRWTPDATLRLLYAGRLLEWKGVDLALHAIRELRERGVPARLTIVGNGRARARLMQQAAELDLKESIRWVTWLPQDQLHEHYYQHDALLFPSLRDSGGMVVLESLAHGLPVVCTDRGGPGLIVNERCGRVVRTSRRTRDEVIGALADALFELGSDRTLLKKLSAVARSRAWEFDFHNVVGRLHPVVGVEEESELARRSAS